MNIYSSLLTLLLLSGISALSFSTLSAQDQDPVNSSLQVFHVGILDGESATSIPQSAEFHQWITDHSLPASIDQSATPQNYTSSIILDPRSGWNYLAGWDQGSSEILIRFQLILEGEKLNLLEVGSYQACICEGCTDLRFSQEMPACECEGADCQYLMGETLH